MAQHISIPVYVVLVAAIVAGVVDVWKFRVHNVLTLPLLLSAFVYHALTGGGPGLGTSLVGFAFGFGVMLLLYLMGGMGAGDVKFVAAVGAWLGFYPTAVVLVASCLAAGCYALALMLCYGKAGETWINLRIIYHRFRCIGQHLGHDGEILTELRQPERRQRLIPFTAMVAVGLVSTLAFAWLMLQR